MLSNPLRRYSPYFNSSSGQDANISTPQPYASTYKIDSFGHGSSYSFHQPQQQLDPSTPQSVGPNLQPKRPLEKGEQTSGANQKLSGVAAAPVRRRISRACDQCNQLRTKCDGQHPCAHCIEFGLNCEFAREKKKRGKTSRKDIASQQAAAAAAAANNEHSSSTTGLHPKLGSRNDSPDALGSDSIISVGNNGLQQNQHRHRHRTAKSQEELEATHAQPVIDFKEINLNRDCIRDIQPSLNIDIYGELHHKYNYLDVNNRLLDNQAFDPSHNTIPVYPNLAYGSETQSPIDCYSSTGFRVTDNHMQEYSFQSECSSGWGGSLSTSTKGYQLHPSQQRSDLRYPVLEPLISYLERIIPVSLACDLLDLYFSSSSPTQMHPLSPYIPAFVFRKRAFLHPRKSRRCQPALLASMLWVSAQTSDAPFLASLPMARERVCQKLLDLTIDLLRPLTHSPSSQVSPQVSPVTSGLSLELLGLSLPESMAGNFRPFGVFGISGSLDDVVTYIHIATVISASENKGASLRWWNAAWSLARELKLGRELPSNDLSLVSFGNGDLGINNLDEHDLNRNRSDFISEEEREERRRIWWLLYMIDRHLALCFNRPLFLLDAECSNLLQPFDENQWQSGHFSNSIREQDEVYHHGKKKRIRGPSFEFRGYSIFGYFLPLMTILGEIVEFHHAKRHPRYSVSFHSSRKWEDQLAEISRHLHSYEQSLETFEQKLANGSYSEDGSEQNHQSVRISRGVETSAYATSTFSSRNLPTNLSTDMLESDNEARVVFAYSSHIMHVLYILLADKWDPVELLENEDSWISTPSFMEASGHALAAAESMNQILEFDPGLKFMPLFYGIYLLQGSFMLIVIADQLKGGGSPRVSKACDTIVRAHEVCVVTPGTEYQRTFCNIIRISLSIALGCIPHDLSELYQRRRELFKLYRWVGDGTGLAL